MHKTCPIHGSFEVPIARDTSWYHNSLGDRSEPSCGCTRPGCPSDTHALPLDRFESLSTCVALIEIVDSCNLACPTCFAGSPVGVGDDVDCRPYEEVVGRIDAVTRRKGFIDILQLSGGEPTIHPRFLDILDFAVAHENIGYVLINTNGVRVARDQAFREALARRRAENTFELYLQFDGPQEAGQKDLRGADLRSMRQRAIDLAGEIGVPTTLAMVVNQQTIDHLGDALRFGLGRDWCRGIVFQPEFSSGRGAETDLTQRLHTGDVVRAVTGQSGGLLSEGDLTPLPCGDPNCHTIGYLLRTAKGPVALGSLVDLSELQGFLTDRVNYSLDDLIQCGCETEPLGEVLKRFELSAEAPFRVFIKPFMDAWNFDQDRIDRCCTHVIRRDGSLDSFCRYYMLGGASAEGPGIGLTMNGRAL